MQQHEHDTKSSPRCRGAPTGLTADNELAAHPHKTTNHDPTHGHPKKTVAHRRLSRRLRHRHGLTTDLHG